jgi:hypothetical protein
MPLKYIKREPDMEMAYLGMTIRPEAECSRGGFYASVTIRDESGKEQLYGPLGHFALKNAAISFAARWEVAFTTGDALPYLPFQLLAG